MKTQQKHHVSGQVKSDEKPISKSSDDAPAVKPTATPRKLSYKHRFRLEKLPQEMADLQTTIQALEAALADGSLFARDPEKFNSSAAALESAKSRLAAAEEEWLRLEMLREAFDASD